VDDDGGAARGASSLAECTAAALTRIKSRGCAASRNQRRRALHAPAAQVGKRRVGARRRMAHDLGLDAGFRGDGQELVGVRARSSLVQEAATSSDDLGYCCAPLFG
jgi:hypothetical protein